MSTSDSERSEPACPGQVRECRMIEMVFPEQTNHYGTLFGGQALALMDKAAFVVASRWCRCTVVTASSDRVDFRRPVKQGQLLELIASLVDTGRSSMRVVVEVWAEDLLGGQRELATRGEFVLVALDAQGKTTAVPPLD
ncbi:acyl-CoA thioesterase [Pseudenhygromyxa sp. WMMC2535]|uniref:acyl-CoA thioesterase n=1 Tax=Pseudenhygromyxa sp. WMMC2535 TaxID=2712867 RepID=UPI0015537E07|nr:acyl-CoA thioesterase [Pseudenhygromyxa sp. WMMC2535]NVB38530.1 acyl-CoA thioesterase [Pseudenhygromyxa sp. WMMC2535]